METKTIKLPLKKKNDSESLFAEATVLRPTIGRMQRYSEHQNVIMGLAESRAVMLDKYRLARQTAANLEASSIDGSDKSEKKKLDEASKRADALLSRANSIYCDMFEMVKKRSAEILSITLDGKAVKSEEVDWDECEAPVLNEASDFFFESMNRSQKESSS
jgi:hypothetical protein